MLTKQFVPIMLGAVILGACDYIVTPDLDVTPTSAASNGWSALVTQVGPAASGDLHIDLTIRNDTNAWSAMQAADGKPAVLSAGGSTTNCDTVFVGTGGTSLAPGFQMRGYTGGTKLKPVTQLLYVECKGAKAAAGAKLTIDYSYVTGDFNYYTPSKPVSATLEVDLDQVAANLTYPVASPVPDTIEKADAPIEAINKCKLTLTKVTRADDGFTFDWQTTNPTDYPTYVHIGIPPVIGSDGIIYGFYQSPSLADAPITPAGQSATWQTTLAVPKDVTGLYMLLSVESKQQKLFVSHALDLTDK